MNKTKIAVLLIIIVGIGFFLRIYNLNKYDFWYDETCSLVIAKYASLHTYFRYSKFSIDSELFIILLHFLVRLFKNELLFRLLPLFFGVLSIILVYPVGKRLFDKEAGLISAFLLAISPFHIYYSQELRSYSLFLFLSLLSVYFLIRILTENKLSLWFCFIISNIFCLYAHKTALLFLLTENFIFLFSDTRKRTLVKWLISQIIILLFFSPGFIILMFQATELGMFPTFSWIPKPSLQTILHTFNVFNFGYRETNKLYLYGNIIFFLVFLLGIWKGLKEKKNVYLLLFWIFMPIIIVLLISLIIKQGSIYISRIFIHILPAYLILIANGLRSIRDKRVFLLFSSLIIMLSTAVLHYYYNNYSDFGVPKLFEIPIKSKYRAAVNYIRYSFQEGDIVVHSSRSTIFPFIYYCNNEMEQRWVFAYDNNDALFLWTKDLFLRYPYLSELNILKPFSVVDIKLVLRGHKRIWLVDSAWDPLYKDQEGPGVKKWLDKNFWLLKKAHFEGIDIYLYKPKRPKMPGYKPVAADYNVL